MNATPTTVERFFAKVNKTETCWLWTASKCTPGYGQFRLGDKIVMAHRLSYEMARGPIPDGLVLDHLCRVVHCVNPNHLEPVTHRVNILRGNAPSAITARENRCRRGHEMTPENIYRVPSTGARACRTCHRNRPSARNRKKTRTV